MGKFSQPRDDQPVGVPPESGEPVITIGAQKAAAAGQTKNRKIILISVCSVAAILLISAIITVFFIFGNPSDDRLILNNVMVAGINLGGMTKDQAKEALHAQTDQTYTNLDMVVELPDMTMNLSPADTGAKLDVDAVVKAAYEYGRTGSRAEREAVREASLTTTHHIPLLNYLSLNLDFIKSELDAYGASFNSVYVPSAVSFDIGAPVLDAGNAKFNADAPCQIMYLTIGAPGRNLDVTKLYNQVLDAYSFNQFSVTAQLEEAETLPDPLDPEALYEMYRCEPTDAYLNPENQQVVYEIYGYDFDLDAAKALLEEAKYGDTVQVPFRFLLPTVMGDDLKALLFRDVLGAFETQHTGNENRNNNLRLACEAINGLVLAAGDTFDFNTVVGQRTIAKGYKSADAYDGGQTVQTVGGGICQVSSTLYYCTLVADLQIIERSPHSYVSSYMPMGMDATVSWGGPHFSFKNNTNYPIRIEAKVEDGYVKIKLIGTDEKDYYIKMDYEIIGVEAPDTVKKEFKPNNKEGYKNGDVVTTPYTGYTVKTYKEKYDKETDELISRDFDQISRYKKRDKVIAKVVKPTESSKDTETDKKPDTPSATQPQTPPSSGGSGNSDGGSGSSSGGSGSGSNDSGGGSGGGSGSSGGGSGSSGSGSGSSGSGSESDKTEDSGNNGEGSD